MEEYAIVQGRRLRCGYTTGSCAAAAAKASALMLLTGESLALIKLQTPKGLTLELEPEEVLRQDGAVTCAIRKDAGDDPDITNGILIYARVEKIAAGLELVGGAGVGIVTKPGLACLPGEPAINPVPRKMIRQEVEKVAVSCGYQGGLRVTISIPAGRKLALSTFNPRLGIEGGLSVLGTSGIVEPMSEKALIETMYTEIKSRKAQGHSGLLAFFGNYGEDFSRDILHLDISQAVTCSNYVGELLDYAVYSGFTSLLLIGHAGKLIKLAQGVMNTHSAYADCRTEFLALAAMFHGASPALGKSLYECITTDEAVRLLKEHRLLEEVVADAMTKIDFYMQRRVQGKLKTAALLFSNKYGVLGQTKEAAALLPLYRR